MFDTIVLRPLQKFLSQRGLPHWKERAPRSRSSQTLAKIQARLTDGQISLYSDLLKDFEDYFAAAMQVGRRRLFV